MGSASVCYNTTTSKLLLTSSKIGFYMSYLLCCFASVEYIKDLEVSKLSMGISMVYSLGLL